MAEYLIESGTAEIEKNRGKAKMRLNTAVVLLDIADEIAGAMSLERVRKMNEVKEVLQRHISPEDRL